MMSLVVNQQYLDTLAYSEEYFIRFIAQSIMIVIIFQLLSDSETILKAFLSMLKVPGKSKFKHFLYDLGLRNALAISLFTLCLVTSIIIPITSFFALLLFWTTVSVAILAYSNLILVRYWQIQHVFCLSFGFWVTRSKPKSACWIYNRSDINILTCYALCRFSYTAS